MNVSKISNKILSNKYALKTLEKISEHGVSFAAGSSLILSLGVRPFSINSTPNVEKENKQYAISNSICSGLVKFGMLEAIALPVENAVINIDKNPEKYLKTSTLNNLKPNSRAYKFITQVMKLSVGLLTAIPKSMLTLALIPVIMGYLTNGKVNGKDEISQNGAEISQEGMGKSLSYTGKQTSFTGNIITNKLSRGVAKIINNEKVQNLANKYEKFDDDVFKHITAGTDILLTSSFAIQTSRSKKIKENRKKALIYYNVLSTGITLLGGYKLDRFVKKRTGALLETFKGVNAGNPKLNKYIEGINILRPALIFAFIYYAVLPVFSTYMAERIDKFVNKNSLKNNE